MWGMRTARQAAVAVLTLIGLAACAPGMQVRPVPVAEPLRIDPTAVLAPIRFDTASVNIRRGRRIGSYRDGLECIHGGEDLWWNWGRVLAVDVDWQDLFFEQMDVAGYHVLGDPQELFRGRKREEVRPAYLVSAQIEDIRLNLCEVADILTGEPLDAQTGKGVVRVYWQVFSVLEKKVVLEADSAGYFEITRPVADGARVLVMEAFAQAAGNFAANPDLYSLLSGPRPTREAILRAEVDERRWLAYVPPFEGGLLGNIDTIRHAVVTIDNGEDHGSGFFIAPDLILTNHHVVAGTKVVRITLTTGRSILGDVVRWHDQRDVALVQVERAGHRALPIRLAPLKEAEDVYAVGSPLSHSRRATVTRGIVSRFGENRFGLPDVQADVDIQPGSSGGPLLDAGGNVVGLAYAGRLDDDKTSIGVNYFIPITDALDKLRLYRRHINDTRQNVDAGLTQ